ncbi:MAG: Lrp/AsnC ligand binding domain-containing protein [Thermoproteota archaeon]
MPDNVIAYFLALVEGGKEHEVAAEIKEIEDVTEVLVVYGMWDIIVRIETVSLGKLDALITEIRDISEIEQTHTLIGASA